MNFTSEETELLRQLRREPRFPIVRMELHNSQEEELVSIALNYVRMTDPGDSMEAVRKRAAALKHLMERGLVFIDYTVRVWVRGDYDVYYASGLYELLCHTVMEAAKRPGAVFDLPYLRKGYASLTGRGARAAMRIL